MKSILVLKTGQAVSTIPPDWGDFEDWIIRGMALPPERFRIVNVFHGDPLPAAESVAGIVVTGSPAMVTESEDWIRQSEMFVRDAVSAGIPVLGICFGHQLLAQALGGEVDWHPEGREIGTTLIQQQAAGAKDQLFSGLPQQFPAHVSHMQSVMTLPEGAVILASNDFDPHHAVRFARLAWGIQFHPEFNEAIVERYIQARKHEIRSEGLDPQALLDQVQAAPDAQRVLTMFAEICETTLTQSGQLV